MQVSVLLFASFAEAAGFREKKLNLPDGATVATAWEGIRQNAPGLARWPRPPLVARNQQYATVETALAAGDEVAFLPPIAGG